jgi:Kiwa protein KwaB-like
MPPDQALQGLAQALTGTPAVNVLVAAEPDVDVVIQRLNLRRDLATEFLSAAQASVPPPGNVVFKPYEPGYKPDQHELSYIELAQQETIAEQIRQLSQVQQAELFREHDEIVDRLRFYAIVISANARRRAVFFRTYSPKKELTRRAGFAALFSRGHYDKVDTKIFLFDRQIDCFSWDGYLFIHNVAAFQRIFKYFEQLRAKANETVNTILAQIPLSNADEFRAACTGQIQMMSKLAQIARKPYLTRVTMRDIRRTIDEFRLDVQIVAENGQERLLFEANPNKRWLILKLLDDAFLGSIMTNQKYEVNSKSALD